MAKTLWCHLIQIQIVQLYANLCLKPDKSSFDLCLKRGEPPTDDLLGRILGKRLLLRQVGACGHVSIDVNVKCGKCAQVLLTYFLIGLFHLTRLNKLASQGLVL